MTGHRFDATDLKLLEILQERGRAKRTELAEEVGLSIPSVSERMRRLQESGFIRSFNAILEPRKVRLEVTAFLWVRSESSKHYSKILDRARKLDEVVECHAITGEGSHILKVRTRNTETLEKLLAEIQSWPGVVGTQTSLVLSTHKETTALHLGYALSDEVIV